MLTNLLKSYVFSSLKKGIGLITDCEQSLTQIGESMKTLDVIAAVLLVIGGLNWLLVGAFDFDLVRFIFGSLPVIQNLVYIIVGLAAIYQIFQWKAIQHRWQA